MNIQLACAASGDYVPHAATMLKSLLINTPGVGIDVHFLHDAAFDSAQRARLAGMLEAHGATLQCHALSPKLPAEVPLAPQYPAAAWFRILLPELLPNIDRLLYLDVDLVVLDSVRPLWEIELEGNIIGAVTNVHAHEPTMAQALGLPAPDYYFNSGVMLMDLAAMRRERVGERVFAWAAAHPELVHYADQDALNALLHARRKALPLRYNVQTTCFHPTHAAPYIAPHEIAAAVTDPAIVHFSNRYWKPWHIRCNHPLRDLYLRYRRQTPWPKYIPDGATLKLRIQKSLPEPIERRLVSLRARLGF